MSNQEHTEYKIEYIKEQARTQSPFMYGQLLLLLGKEGKHLLDDWKVGLSIGEQNIKVIGKIYTFLIRKK